PVACTLIAVVVCANVADTLNPPRLIRPGRLMGGWWVFLYVRGGRGEARSAGFPAGLPHIEFQPRRDALPCDASGIAMSRQEEGHNSRGGRECSGRHRQSRAAYATSHLGWRC